MNAATSSHHDTARQRQFKKLLKINYFYYFLDSEIHEILYENVEFNWQQDIAISQRKLPLFNDVATLYRNET